MDDNPIQEEFAWEKEPTLLWMSSGIVLILAAFANCFTCSKDSAYLVVTAYGFTLFILFYLKNKAIKKSYTWKMLKAKVLNKKIQSRNCIGSRGGIQYYPKIKYAYEVDGEKLTSDNMFFFKCNAYFRTKEEAKKVMDKLVNNKELSIYINPEDKYSSIVLKGEKGEYEVSYMWAILILLIELAAVRWILEPCC